MWDMEGSQQQYGGIDFFVDGVIVFTTVRLIQKFRSNNSNNNDEDKKGGPPVGGPPKGGENKFTRLFGQDKKGTVEPIKKRITVDNDIFR